MNTIEKARIYATAAHAAIGQRRKYRNTPYIEHPRAVALLVAEHGGSAAMIAAAWLHDVVEDTAISLEQLAVEFEPEIVLLVDALSDLQTPADGNRAMRKRRTAERLAAAGSDAQTIKYADLIHNIGSIIEHDPGFARVYLEEQHQLVDVMRDGNPALRQRAIDTLTQATGKLRGRG
ncbi:HD domain-containing protein [Billgrantia saliphila]|uniref:HD domain-containing protein n=1 Tax=Billgrantia saliphila TaxID=1848458 RepID=UPI000CE39D89|nr:HD domain-containing protein [Halomonas saliphila]